MKGRSVTFAWVASFMVAMIAMFFVKYEVNDLTREWRALERDKQRHGEAIRVLQSEWSYLNRPARLSGLAEAHLELEPVRLTQLGWEAPGAETALAPATARTGAPAR